MIHADHKDLPGYDVRQVWHDGCGACSDLALGVPYTVHELDDFTLCRALNRAEQMQWNATARTGRIAHNERSLLIHLHGCMNVMRRLRHIGFSVADIKP